MYNRAKLNLSKTDHLASQENESPELVQSRENLIAAKGRKDTVFRSHLQAQNSKTNNSLIDAIRSKGNYSAAWQAEKTAQQALADLRAPSLSSASAQLEVVRLADMRLEPQKGYEHPSLLYSCVITDMH